MRLIGGQAPRHVVPNSGPTLPLEAPYLCTGVVPSQKGGRIRLGIPARKRAITADKLRAGDEIFFTGTTMEIRSTVDVDGRPVRNGRPVCATRPLSQALPECGSVDGTVGMSRELDDSRLLPYARDYL
ncbi:MAG: hypothetical protein OXT72_14085 [Gammaproteobacteria bacterium]|nr:hypothetical protein [Gammaproteobacteria bacterium]MDE0247924.1 hypothetical protein [Gammaproteobacteria bacterium]